VWARGKNEETRVTAYHQQTIMVIDDQKPVRELIASMVAKLGFGEVVVAEDGVHALDKLASSRPDLIVCDYTMPFLSGLDFVAALRLGLTAADPMTPLIMLTADADQQKIRAAAWLGVQDFLRKPVSVDTLTDRVAYALANPPTTPANMVDLSLVQDKLASAVQERAAAQ